MSYFRAIGIFLLFNSAKEYPSSRDGSSSKVDYCIWVVIIVPWYV